MAAETATFNTQRSARIWPLLTILGVIIYIGVDVALAFLRPDYLWLHNAESDYGRGPYFWLMDGNFLLRCFLSLALVRALVLHFPGNTSIRQASRWLAVWAVASGLLAFFADNPYGYPKLGSGSVHLLLAFVAFIAALVAMVAFRRLAPLLRLGAHTAFSLTALMVVAVASLILLGHARFRPHSLGGLYERIFLGAVLGWEVILAVLIVAQNRTRAQK